MNANWSELDETMMRAALQEAQAAALDNEVPVGAVIARDGEIVARGRNASIQCNDPSAHAEIVALREAGQVTGNHRMPGTILYVTLEPCAMCVGAIVQARVARLVFGAYDAKSGAVGSVIDLSDSAVFNHRFEVNGGVLADECGALLKQFFGSRR